MSIIRSTTPKDAVVNDIVNREWEMFQKTQNMGGRAACQDQYDTFYANRYSQHSILQPDTLESYRNDLIAAGMIGRNLITEKYGYMMEFTDPDYYNANRFLDQEIHPLLFFGYSSPSSPHMCQAH